MTKTSFAYEVTTAGDNGVYTSNAFRFATEAEAEAYGSDLSGRWLAIKDGRVRLTLDPVNYVWSEGRAVRLEEGSN